MAAQFQSAGHKKDTVRKEKNADPLEAPGKRGGRKQNLLSERVNSSGTDQPREGGPRMIENVSPEGR